MVSKAKQRILQLMTSKSFLTHNPLTIRVLIINYLTRLITKLGGLCTGISSIGTFNMPSSSPATWFQVSDKGRCQNALCCLPSKVIEPCRVPAKTSCVPWCTATFTAGSVRPISTAPMLLPCQSLNPFRCPRVGLRLLCWDPCSLTWDAIPAPTNWCQRCSIIQCARLGVSRTQWSRPTAMKMFHRKIYLSHCPVPSTVHMVQRILLQGMMCIVESSSGNTTTRHDVVVTSRT